MTKMRHDFRLYGAAFLLPIFAGYIALAADAFLFPALLPMAALASLFHSSGRIKTAARCNSDLS